MFTSALTSAVSDWPKDCVAMLKKMYGGDDGSTKHDLMEYGDLLTNFFGCEEKG